MWLVRMCTMYWRSFIRSHRQRTLYAALSICNGGMINTSNVNKSQGQATHRGKVGMREVSYNSKFFKSISI